MIMRFNRKLLRSARPSCQADSPATSLWWQPRSVRWSEKSPRKAPSESVTISSGYPNGCSQMRLNNRSVSVESREDNLPAACKCVE
eukprot:773010-Amphidinium_carterae.2